MRSPVGVIASSAQASSATGPGGITGLQSWYDADDAATVFTSTGKVYRWDDKSGNANTMNQGSDANRPALVAGGIKAGRNSIDFSGGSKYLTTPLGANTKPCHCFAVIKHTGAASDRCILGTSQSGGFLWELRPDHKQLVNKHYIANMSTSNTAVPANVMALVEVSLDTNGQFKFSLNTVPDGGVIYATNFDAASPISVIGEGNAQAFVGSIGEILRYTRVLTSGEVAVINNYLLGRWA